MENDKSRHIAAPISLDLDGKQWTFSPLKLRDFKQLEGMLQGAILKSIPDGLDEEARDFYRQQAWDDAKKIKFGTRDFDIAAQDPDGIIAMIFLSLKHRHHDVTLDEVNDLLTPKNTGEIREAIQKMAGYSDPLKVEGKNPKRKQ